MEANLDYYQSLTKEALEQRIKDQQFEIKAHWEMHESKRLGYDPHGPSLSDLEHEIGEGEWHLQLMQWIMRVHTILARYGYSYVKNTLQYESEYYFICQVEGAKGKFCFIYEGGKYVTLNTKRFHTLRRYTTNYQDEYWEK